MRPRSVYLSGLSVLFAAAFTLTSAPSPPDDPVITALETELDRAMAGFAERTEQPPYFLAYEVWDRWEDGLTATHGAIVADRTNRRRLLDVDVRIGDYEFDNTHRLQGQGAVFRGAFGSRAEPLTLEDDVEALRAVIWLRTESEYRQATEQLIQVVADRAATAAPQDTSPDFSHEQPYVLVETIPAPLELDRSVWSDRLRRLSSGFADRAAIYNSTVSLRALREVRYIVNSEGTRVRTGDTHVRLSVQASTRADDGMDLSLHRTFFAFRPDGLPSETAIAAAIDTLIDELEALRTAPVAEPFTGPAILSGQASAVFFHEIFGHRIEGHRQKDESFAQTFTKKVGEEILPTYVDVFDDPSRRSYNGIELSGHYRVDDEGVPTRSVTVVEDGIMTGFLMSRSPIQAAPQSNGHGRRQPGRDVVARQGNLIVESERTVSSSELRARLIEEVKRQGKPYGLYFSEIQGGFTFTGRMLPQSFKVIPMKVYRVYPDGRQDELVRGVDIVGTPLTVFGKIVATDDVPEVFNGMCGAESGTVPVSAVSPAILVSEIEVEKKSKSMQRPPILAPPAATMPAGRERDETGATDILLQALSDELARSADSLRLEGLAEPYYLAYRVDDGLTLQIEARFGAVAIRDRQRSRMLEVAIRVGGPEADNWNFLDPTSMFGGMRTVRVPLEDRYGAIRHQLWRLSDDRYKRAAEALAGKTAALEGRLKEAEIPDFSEEPPHVSIQPRMELSLEEAPWVELARRASAVFRDYPMVEDARARVLVRLRNRYFTSSDGSRSRVPEAVYAVLLTTTARARSGRTVKDYRLFVAPTANGLPSGDSILAAARNLAEDLTARAAAESPETYLGPVLFEERAAAQFFDALLGRHLSGTPNPVAPGAFAGMVSAEKRLERLLGRRIMPSDFAVVDDPTRSDYNGKPLVGHYAVDHEGMPPQPVSAVEQGTLKAFLMSRTPSRSSVHTTGHARSGIPGTEPRATIGNLIVEATDALAPAELRTEFLRLVEDLGLEYGIVVRGLADQSILKSDASSFNPFAMMAGLGRPQSQLPPPVAAFKLYPDGHEEPIQGMEFVDVTVRALRDIVAASEDDVVYNFLYSGDQSTAMPFLSIALTLAPFQWGQLPASIVAPAVLVEELELRQTEPEGKPPVLTHPYFDRRR